jgi:MarR family transcriptional regulator, organic hydroperoxide resistance regulator
MDGDSLSTDPFERIERAILRIGWLGQRQFLQLLAEERFDLTIPQFYTLLHLSHCADECKMSDLARATHQSAASLTGVVDRLLEKRLVARVRPEGDRRQVMVTATDLGCTLLAKIAAARRVEMRMALEHLASEDIGELLRLLDTVILGMQHAVEARELHE